MGDYHDLYIKTDVLLLADIFGKFISTCLEYYKLDPCHYFSSPGLSCDAILKMARIELELISGTDMCLSMKKEWEELFLTLLKDSVKQIINTCNHIIIKSNAYIIFI